LDFFFLVIEGLDFPSQAEIVGRVTGVAMRIIEEQTPGTGETVRSVDQ
jgi:hypothetical protein